MLKASETVIVCRVEHRTTGEGPYRPKFYDALVKMHDAHDDVDEHPAPRFDDMDPIVYTEMLFGFENKEQLDIWFEPHFKKLMDELGFIIREYEVPIDSIEYGGHQVAFDQVDSTMIGEKTLWWSPLCAV